MGGISFFIVFVVLRPLRNQECLLLPADCRSGFTLDLGLSSPGYELDRRLNDIDHRNRDEIVREELAMKIKRVKIEHYRSWKTRR